MKYLKYSDKLFFTYVYSPELRKSVTGTLRKSGIPVTRRITLFTYKQLCFAIKIYYIISFSFFGEEEMSGRRNISIFFYRICEFRLIFHMDFGSPHLTSLPSTNLHQYGGCFQTRSSKIILISKFNQRKLYYFITF